MSLAFDWIDVTCGRARFSGSVRGWDDLERDTFAIDLRGTTYFGEIELVGSTLESAATLVVSYGFAKAEEVGAPGLRSSFSQGDASMIEGCIRQLVSVVAERPRVVDRPSVLVLQQRSVLFSDGWILVAPHETVAS